METPAQQDEIRVKAAKTVTWLIIEGEGKYECAEQKGESRRKTKKKQK